MRTIAGLAQISSTPGCDGVEANVYMDSLTLGVVPYNVLRECCLDVANFLARLVLNVTGDRLSIVASGSPLLPNIVKQPGETRACWTSSGDPGQ